MGRGVPSIPAAALQPRLPSVEAHFLPSPALQLVLKPPLRNVQQGASGGAGDSEMRSGRTSMGEAGGNTRGSGTPLYALGSGTPERQRCSEGP